jgi:hypothetical protein
MESSLSPGSSVEDGEAQAGGGGEARLNGFANAIPLFETVERRVMQNAVHGRQTSICLPKIGLCLTTTIILESL